MPFGNKILECPFGRIQNFKGLFIKLEKRKYWMLTREADSLRVPHVVRMMVVVLFSIFPKGNQYLFELILNF